MKNMRSDSSRTSAAYMAVKSRGIDVLVGIAYSE